MERATSCILLILLQEMARVTGLEPAASGVTGRRSNQLSYTRVAIPSLSGRRVVYARPRPWSSAFRGIVQAQCAVCPIAPRHAPPRANPAVRVQPENRSKSVLPVSFRSCSWLAKPKLAPASEGPCRGHPRLNLIHRIKFSATADRLGMVGGEGFEPPTLSV